MSIWLEFVWRVLLLIPVLVGISLAIGPRSISDIRVLDFLFIAIIGAMAAHTMVTLDTLLLGTVIAMIVLTGAYWLLLRYGMANTRFRRVVTPGPALLIRDGTIDALAMRRSNIDLDSLLAMLRGKNVFSLSDIDTAILETSGRLSIVTNADAEKRSHAIVLDGGIDDRELQRAGKTRMWLTDELRRRRLSLANVLLAAYSRKGELYIARKGDQGAGEEARRDEEDGG